MLLDIITVVISYEPFTCDTFLWTNQQETKLHNGIGKNPLGPILLTFTDPLFHNSTLADRIGFPELCQKDGSVYSNSMSIDAVRHNSINFSILHCIFALNNWVVVDLAKCVLQLQRHTYV